MHAGRDAEDPRLDTIDFPTGRVATVDSPATGRGSAPGARHPLSFPRGYVIGSSPAMNRLYSDLSVLAATDLPLLIEGETGVGKEAIAHIVHRSSNRGNGPFVAINCAAIPSELIEAELFGIADGVATGVRRRVGLIQCADGGTLFLDEVADMPLGLQAKLLRVLQDRVVKPVGGPAKRFDARIVTASNADLRKRVASKRFRDDVYYRVAGAVLRVPPLRERRQDLPALIDHFARHARADGFVPRFTASSLESLARFDWPGNVRQLEHLVIRLSHVCGPGERIGSDLLSRHGIDEAACPRARGAPTDSLRLSDQVEATERKAILRALAHAEGSRRKAAKLLGISRSTLARKIERLGIADA